MIQIDKMFIGEKEFLKYQKHFKSNEAVITDMIKYDSPELEYKMKKIPVAYLKDTRQIFTLNMKQSRRILILGSTGSGKTTLEADIVDRFTKSGGVVTMFDLKGEFVNKHLPLQDKYANKKVHDKKQDKDYPKYLFPEEKPQGFDIVVYRPAFLHNMYDKGKRLAKKEKLCQYSISSLTRADMNIFFKTLIDRNPRYMEFIDLLYDNMKKHKLYSWEKIHKFMQDSPDFDRHAQKLIGRTLKLMEKTGVLGDVHDYPDLVKDINEGKMSIINMRGMLNMRNKDSPALAYVNLMLRQIYDSKVTGKIDPKIHNMIVISEANKFCFDKETEVLTNKGWKKYNQINKKDLVAGFDYKKEQYKWTKIQDIIIKNHSGKMMKYKSRSLDILVTPEHRMVTKTRRKGEMKKWVIHRADNMYSQWKIPIGKTEQRTQEYGISDDMLKIIGWINTDGCYSNNISLCQKKDHQKFNRNLTEEMKKIILRNFPDTHIKNRTRTTTPPNGKKYVHTSTEFNFTRADSRKILKYFDKDFDTIHHIPRKLMENCSTRQLKILYQAMMDGDGTSIAGKNNGKNYRYYGKNKKKGGKTRIINWYVTAFVVSPYNKKLADDFQELCTRIGLNSTLGKIKFNKQYRITISKRKESFSLSNNFEKINYSGIVWDLSVPTDAFVVRRKGKVYVTGNCPNASDNPVKKEFLKLLDLVRSERISIILDTQDWKRIPETIISQSDYVLLPYNIDMENMYELVRRILPQEYDSPHDFRPKISYWIKRMRKLKDGRRDWLLLDRHEKRKVFIQPVLPLSYLQEEKS